MEADLCPHSPCVLTRVAMCFCTLEAKVRLRTIVVELGTKSHTICRLCVAWLGLCKCF
jgi:hypothetical protein